ncbi:unnamed protein product [Pleuronectes platessa]|uniref:Uncharacterized protein n=1 Tax=Pleuronectes platessa TaxID=8262 RepID=A0A9N7VD88_PLEPL|nr:unnamed protein product [Pleuronectes platessa]
MELTDNLRVPASTTMTQRQQLILAGLPCGATAHSNKLFHCTTVSSVIGAKRLVALQGHLDGTRPPEVKPQHNLIDTRAGNTCSERDGSGGAIRPWADSIYIKAGMEALCVGTSSGSLGNKSVLHNLKWNL